MQAFEIYDIENPEDGVPRTILCLQPKDVAKAIHDYDLVKFKIGRTHFDSLKMEWKRFAHVRSVDNE